MNGLLSNPWVNIGLGILGANKPGVSAGQAVGRGGLLGMESFHQQQQAQQMEQYRQAQAHAARQKAMLEQEQWRAAQEKADKQAQAFEAMIATWPPEQQAAARAGLETQAYKHMYPNQTGGMGLRVGPDGSVEFGTGAAWQGMGASPLSTQAPLYAPGDKTERRKLRGEAREMVDFIGVGNQLKTMLEETPEAAGWFGEKRHETGAFLEQAGDQFGSSTLKTWGKGLRKNIGAVRSVGGVYVRKAKALLMRGEGRMSDQDFNALLAYTEVLKASASKESTVEAIDAIQSIALSYPEIAAEAGISIGATGEGAPQPSGGTGEPTDDELLNMMLEDVRRNQ